MKQFMIFLSLVMLFGLFSTRPVDAQYYGNDGGKALIVVDKKIKLPTTNKFVDNIDKGTYIFAEGTQIEFLITVENRSTVTINDVNLVDYLPDYLKLQYVFGTDNKAGKLETKITSLNPGEIKEYKIIALLNNLPNSEYSKSIKQVNKVCASNSIVSDCDTAVYYVGTKTLPVTGNSVTTLIIESFLLSTVVGGGFVLRKLVRG
jgi:uncharacterized repeat protein (TIGR01451 family)